MTNNTIQPFLPSIKSAYSKPPSTLPSDPLRKLAATQEFQKENCYIQATIKECFDLIDKQYGGLQARTLAFEKLVTATQSAERYFSFDEFLFLLKLAVEIYSQNAFPDSLKIKTITTIIKFSQTVKMREKHINAIKWRQYCVKMAETLKIKQEIASWERTICYVLSFIYNVNDVKPNELLLLQELSMLLLCASKPIIETAHVNLTSISLELRNIEQRLTFKIAKLLEDPKIGWLLIRDFIERNPNQRLTKEDVINLSLFFRSNQIAPSNGLGYLTRISSSCLLESPALSELLIQIGIAKIAQLNTLTQGDISAYIRFLLTFNEMNIINKYAVEICSALNKKCLPDLTKRSQQNRVSEPRDALIHSKTHIEKVKHLCEQLLKVGSITEHSRTHLFHYILTELEQRFHAYSLPDFQKCLSALECWVEQRISCHATRVKILRMHLETSTYFQNSKEMWDKHKNEFYQGLVKTFKINQLWAKDAGNVCSFFLHTLDKAKRALAKSNALMRTEPIKGKLNTIEIQRWLKTKAEKSKEEFSLKEQAMKIYFNSEEVMTSLICQSIPAISAAESNTSKHNIKRVIRLNAASTMTDLCIIDTLTSSVLLNKADKPFKMHESRKGQFLKILQKEDMSFAQTLKHVVQIFDKYVVPTQFAIDFLSTLFTKAAIESPVKYSDFYNLLTFLLKPELQTDKTLLLSQKQKLFQIIKVGFLCENFVVDFPLFRRAKEMALYAHLKGNFFSYFPEEQAALSQLIVHHYTARLTPLVEKVCAILELSKEAITEINCYIWIKALVHELKKAKLLINRVDDSQKMLSKNSPLREHYLKSKKRLPLLLFKLELFYVIKSLYNQIPLTSLYKNPALNMILQLVNLKYDSEDNSEPALIKSKGSLIFGIAIERSSKDPH